ncbi:MAG: lytic transglycosylase domain-containing protein [Bacteroidetes bacterium]|nr:lytic transglycosylase domain-containing protein [Bacteroidota bacterium]MBU1113642.1 lytic transglycosylase domain-containing protein [Bacteroidota bacterium]MBU1796782.1 lytic transglycosylase domain-containing protein [Bacteroidota bacterium]
MLIKNNKFVYFISGILFSILVFFVFSFDSPNSSISQNSNETFPQGYHVISPYIPEQLDFCGEPVPLENIDVRERVEREFIVQTYYHSASILYLKRINRWFPLIENILEEKGIPNDFKYLALAESGLEDVVSPAGAVGFWQLMDYNGPKYGLIINKEIDERYNVEKSTYAACAYILEAKERFGTWTLAAASYNKGLNGIDNQLERQKATNYYNLVLNKETSRYIPRILALKYVMEHPQYYGFDIKKEQLYLPYLTYKVKLDSSVAHLADFAKLHEINYKTLKLFNPWLRDNYLTNKEKKRYFITLPKKGSFEIIPD